MGCADVSVLAVELVEEEGVVTLDVSDEGVLGVEVSALGEVAVVVAEDVSVGVVEAAGAPAESRLPWVACPVDPLTDGTGVIVDGAVVGAVVVDVELVESVVVGAVAPTFPCCYKSCCSC